MMRPPTTFIYANPIDIAYASTLFAVGGASMSDGATFRDRAVATAAGVAAGHFTSSALNSASKTLLGERLHYGLDVSLTGIAAYGASCLTVIMLSLLRGNRPPNQNNPAAVAG